MIFEQFIEKMPILNLTCAMEVIRSSNRGMGFALLLLFRNSTLAFFCLYEM
jgi:hypothetical protein